MLYVVFWSVVWPTMLPEEYKDIDKLGKFEDVSLRFNFPYHVEPHTTSHFIVTRWLKKIVSRHEAHRAHRFH